MHRRRLAGLVPFAAASCRPRSSAAESRCSYRRNKLRQPCQLKHCDISPNFATAPAGVVAFFEGEHAFKKAFPHISSYNFRRCINLAVSTHYSRSPAQKKFAHWSNLTDPRPHGVSGLEFIGEWLRPISYLIGRVVLSDCGISVLSHRYRMQSRQFFRLNHTHLKFNIMSLHVDNS